MKRHNAWFWWIVFTGFLVSLVPFSLIPAMLSLVIPEIWRDMYGEESIPKTVLMTLPFTIIISWPYLIFALIGRSVIRSGSPLKPAKWSVIGGVFSVSATIIILWFYLYVDVYFIQHEPPEAIFFIGGIETLFLWPFVSAIAFAGGLLGGRVAGWLAIDSKDLEKS